MKKVLGLVLLLGLIAALKTEELSDPRRSLHITSVYDHVMVNSIAKNRSIESVDLNSLFGCKVMRVEVSGDLDKAYSCKEAKTNAEVFQCQLWYLANGVGERFQWKDGFYFRDRDSLKVTCSYTVIN